MNSYRCAKITSNKLECLRDSKCDFSNVLLTNNQIQNY